MKNKIIDLSKKLIMIPSTKDNQDALNATLELAKNELSGFKYKAFEKEGNRSIIFYNTAEIPNRFKIILNAHLDIVPALKEQYLPFEKDGRLYGRGAIDMKAAGAVEILLFKELANTIKYPLGLQLVTDEELDGCRGVKYQAEKGILADFVIAGEQTDFGINNEAKGVLWVKLTTKGRTAHGAHLWEGKNAIWKMVKALNNLRKIYPTPEKEVWKTTVNLSRIETSNKTTNKVPDDCATYLDVRFVPEEKEIIINKVKEIFSKLADVEIVEFGSPQFTDEKNKYIELLKKIIKEKKGTKAKMSATHGTSDIRHYNDIGCDGITFGPIGFGLHTDNEWVNIKSLYEFYDILKDFLKLA